MNPGYALGTPIFAIAVIWTAIAGAWWLTVFFVVVLAVFAYGLWRNRRSDERW